MIPTEFVLSSERDTRIATRSLEAVPRREELVYLCADVPEDSDTVVGVPSEGWYEVTLVVWRTGRANSQGPAIATVLVTPTPSPFQSY